MNILALLAVESVWALFDIVFIAWNDGGTNSSLIILIYLGH